MNILELLIAIILVAWILGALVVPVGGSLIHVLLIVVLVILVLRIAQGKSV